MTTTRGSQKKQSGSLMFVQISHPSESAAWKKSIRSHAARHPTSRRKDKTKDSHGCLTPPHSESGEPEEIKSSPWFMSSSCPPAQLAASQSPSPSTMVSAVPQDPFDTSIRTLSGFEKNLFYIFQEEDVLNRIDHIPGMRINVPSQTARKFWTSLTHHWLHAATYDQGMLACVCLFACRHVQTKMGHRYPDLIYQHAEIYKTAVMENLSVTLEKEVADNHVNDNTITKTLALVSDSTASGDVTGAFRHMAAAADLVDLRVGFMKGTQSPERDRDMKNLRIFFSESSGLDGALGGVIFDGAENTPPAKAGKQKQLVFRIGRIGQKHHALPFEPVL